MKNATKDKLYARLEAIQIYLDDSRKICFENVKREQTPAEKCVYELTEIIERVIADMEVTE